MGTTVSRQRLLVLFTAALLACGCGDSKKKRKEQPEEKPRNPLLGNPQPGAGGLRRVADRPKVQNDLRSLGQFYNLYLTEFGRAPRTVEELANYLKRDSGTLFTALTEGTYVIILGKKVDANGVLAYEKTPDANGLQTVLRGDGNSVTTMSSQELQKALQSGA